MGNQMQQKQVWLDANLPPEARAEALLQKMSPAEKLAQAVGIFFPQMELEKPEYALGVGSVSCLGMRTLDTRADAANFQRNVQAQIMARSPHQIPAIFHMEGLTGAFIQGADSFPSGIARGATFHPELEETIAQVVARQELAIGITHIFAPVVDVSRDPRMGRMGESYGEDPTLVSVMGTSYTRGIQSKTVNGRRADAVAKHFVGSHAVEGGVHAATCYVAPRDLIQTYAKPFQAAITEGGLKGVMPSYNVVNNEPVSASKSLLTDLLRKEMGFADLMVSDYSAIANIHLVQKVCHSLDEAGLRALEAGLDMELPNVSCWNEDLLRRFTEGAADISILDAAVKRILTAKFRMGLFEYPFALPDDEIAKVYDRPEDRAINLQAARESLVLLKNEGILPLASVPKRIALIGSPANNAAIFFGGYTHLSMAEAVIASRDTMAGGLTLDGVGSDWEKAPVEAWPGTKVQRDDTPPFTALLQKKHPNIQSLFDELQTRLPDCEIIYAWGYPVAGSDDSGHEVALEAIKRADVAILTLGGKHGSTSVATMGEGVDATNIGLPDCQESFIQKAAQLGVPLVGVHFDGRPISSDVADECLNAILEAWNPAETGAEAITDVLLGKVAPSGRLPVSVPYNAGQIPIYTGHLNGAAWHQGESIGFNDYVDMPHTPRYYFGHGLTYTLFSYSDLTIDQHEVAPDERVTITVTVANTGKREGTEVVQLYLSDRYASMARPSMELAGFKRVSLLPGTRATVCFCLRPSQLAFLDREMRWLIEEGEIDVLVGASAGDIRLTDTFRITQSQIIDGKTRAFWAETSSSSTKFNS